MDVLIVRHCSKEAPLVGTLDGGDRDIIYPALSPYQGDMQDL